MREDSEVNVRVSESTVDEDGGTVESGFRGGESGVSSEICVGTGFIRTMGNVHVSLFT